MLIRPIQSEDLSFIREELVRHWGDVGVWSVGRCYQADQLPGFVAVEPGPRDKSYLGLVTYAIIDGGFQAEIVTLSSRRENSGVGTALLNASVEAIRAAGCVRAFLCTTNDNLRALGFYQKRGWTLAKLHKGCIEDGRQRVPSIPRVGMHGIELRDELELEMWLR